MLLECMRINTCRRNIIVVRAGHNSPPIEPLSSPPKKHVASGNRCFLSPASHYSMLSVLLFPCTHVAPFHETIACLRTIVIGVGQYACGLEDVLGLVRFADRFCRASLTAIEVGPVLVSPPVMV